MESVYLGTENSLRSCVGHRIEQNHGFDTTGSSVKGSWKLY